MKTSKLANLDRMVWWQNHYSWSLVNVAKFKIGEASPVKSNFTLCAAFIINGRGEKIPCKGFFNHMMDQ